MKLSQEIGVDLGTTTILVYIKSKGIVLIEPSVVAIDKTSGEVIAYGKDAFKLIGRSPKNVETIYPLKDGVISDYTITEKMLNHCISAVSDQKLINPSMVICVPSGVTKLEKKAVIDAAIKSGARRVNIIQEPLAAAIGAGIDVTKPNGVLVVDIGGGTTDIAAISFGGIVKSESIKVAGNTFNDQIKRYVKDTYNLIIGEKTAEKIKIGIGAVYRKTAIQKMIVKGKCTVTGYPKEIELTSDELYEPLYSSASKIIDAIKDVLEQLSPELSSDIKENGICITGGGALISGMDKLIYEAFGIEVKIPDNPIECVVLCTGKSLDNLVLLDDVNGLICKNKLITK